MLKDKRNITADQTGLTLVELVISLALLTFAVLGSSRLINAAARASGEAGRRTQATFLAEREFEMLRNIRDGNIASGSDAWDNLPVLVSGTTQDCEWFYMEVAPGAGSQPSWGVSAMPLSATTTQPYDSSRDSLASESTELYAPFARRVEMCTEINNDRNSLLHGQYDENIRRINVIVEWQEASGPPRTVKISNIMTDWSQGL